MVTAFVLIKIEDKDVTRMSEKILSNDGVQEVHVVAGEYDMVAILRVEDNNTLSSLLTDHVIHTEGILSTKTLISLQMISE